MADVLKGYPECLYRADDAEDLAQRIRNQLRQPTPPVLRIDDWEKIIGGLEPRVRSVVLAGKAA